MQKKEDSRHDNDHDGFLTMDEWYLAYEDDLVQQGRAHVSKDLMTLEVPSAARSMLTVCADCVVCDERDQTAHQQSARKGSG